jgi:predicted phosphodiesterase
MGIKRDIDLSSLSTLIAASPTGRARLEAQRIAIETLSGALTASYKKGRPYVIPAPIEGNVIKFAALGDTHIGSLYHRHDAMKQFYHRCREEGYKLALHAGDVVAGWHVYRGQEFELHPHAKSWPEQEQMFLEEAEMTSGMDVVFITGNHDNSFKKLVGIVPGEEFGRRAENWKFIGQDYGDVALKTPAGEKFTVRLLHPGGGTAYALSYHMQKIIESMSGGQKPNMVIAGHYHKSMFIPQYRGVAGLYPGCFESQTPFMIQRGIAASIGGWLIRVTIGKRGALTNRIQAEWVGFFEEKDK